MTERLTRDYVARCRADVSEAVSGLRRARWNQELAQALHQSLSTFLNREVGRLRRHQPATSVLSRMSIDAAQYRAQTDAADLDPAVRTRAAQWRAGVIELLGRIENDWHLLVQSFGLQADAKVTGISEPLGDLHNGGRSVCKVTFDDGRALVYKPRSVEAERTFGRLARWLGRRGFEPALQSCEVLSRSGYGWTNHVTSWHCRTPHEAEAYYERQGAFLAIFYLLCGGDCIDENVIGVGPDPVWVDTECVCAPKPPATLRDPRVPAWLNDSVLTTSFVFWPNDMNAPPRAFTALSMSCATDRSTIFAEGDILREPYIGAVKRGFRKLYEWTLAHRGIWVSEEGPLSWWRDVRVRVIPRATALYETLADSLLIAPAALAADVRLAVEQALYARRESTAWPPTLVRAEMAALERADVPYWTTSTRSRDMREAIGPSLPNVMDRTGMEHVRDRAARLSAKDLDDQLWVIETFLRVPNRGTDQAL